MQYIDIKKLMAKKMSPQKVKKPSISEGEQENFNRVMDSNRKRHSHRYSDDMVHYKPLGQRYRERSRKQLDEEKRKVAELRKEFPTQSP